MGAETIPTTTLGAEQADALRSVDVRLLFDNHGSTYLHPEHGLQTLRVGDEEYGRMERVVGQLDPARGDVFATESAGHDQPWREGFKNDMHYIDERSPYLQTGDFPGAVDLDPAALAGYMRRVRDMRIGGPQLYGEGLAAARGLTVAYADTTLAEALSRPGRYDDREVMLFRAERMVHRLGARAMGMPAQRAERPVLQFAAGTNHADDVMRVLDKAGVSYAAEVHGTQGRAHGALEKVAAKLYTAAERASTHVIGYTPSFVPTPADAESKRWVQNLERKL
jgi:hypothetical protein